MPRALPIARFRNICFSGLTLVATLWIAACGGGGSGGASTAPPTGSPLTLSPVTTTVGAGTSETFVASGGQPPYSYSVASGTGAIDSTSGVFTAPSAAGSATLKVTDAGGQNATAAVTINAAFAIVPATITMTASSAKTFQFSGAGGTGGDQFSLS